MYASFGSDYDQDAAIIEDANTVAAMANDWTTKNAAVAKCPQASALVPALLAARSALASATGYSPPDIKDVQAKRDAVTAMIRKVQGAVAACQGKEDPYAKAERDRQAAAGGGSGIPGQAGPASSKSEIAAWQTFLSQRGCNPGAIDGLWGPATAAATQRFNQGKCTGAGGVTPGGGGYKPPAPPVAPPQPSPPVGPVAPPPPPETKKAEIISGIPNSALAVGGLALVALAAAVIVKKRRSSDYGSRSSRRTVYQEPMDFEPMTAPMSRTRPSASSRRPSSSRRVASSRRR